MNTTTIIPSEIDEEEHGYDQSIIVMLCLCLCPFVFYGYAWCLRFFCPLERKRKKRQIVVQTDIQIPKTSLIKELNKKNKHSMIKSDCCICLEKINFGGLKKQKYLSLECSHVFHYDCLETWVSSEMEKGRAAKCPVCRGELDELKDKEIFN